MDYTTKDWMMGNSKMQDWKAAVRNWERNQAKKNAKPRSQGNRTLHTWNVIVIMILVRWKDSCLRSR